MEKQQTAVEFYDQQLHILDLRLKSGSITIGEYFTLKSELFAQSKQMEKEQMDKACGDWWNEGASYMYEGKRKYESFEQYYESKYGKDEDKAENND